MSEDVVYEAEHDVIYAAEQAVDRLSELRKKDAANRFVFISKRLTSVEPDVSREFTSELVEVFKELWPDWESFTVALGDLNFAVSQLRALHSEETVSPPTEAKLMHEVSILACNYWRAQKKFEAVIQNMEVQVNALQTRAIIHDTPDEEIGQFVKRSMDAMGNLGEQEFVEMTAKLDQMFVSIEKLETYRVTRNKSIVEKLEAR
jgi:hypothetical protein